MGSEPTLHRWPLGTDPTGATAVSIGRTIGEGDFSLLTNLTWLTGEAHVNRLHGGGDDDGRVLPPITVAAVGLGLGWTSSMRGKLIAEFGLQALKSTSLTVTGGVGVHPGDTLHVASSVDAAVVTVGADGQEMALTIAHDVRNQRDETTVVIIQQLLVCPAVHRPMATNSERN